MKRALSVVLALAGLGFVAVLLVRHWEEAEAALADASAGWLLLALPSAAAGIVAVALGWARIVGGDRRALVAAFFAGEIGKYVPGGIWPVVGRAERAVALGVERKAAYRSVVVSLVAVYTAAGVAALSYVHPLLTVAGALVLLHPRGRMAAQYLPAWVLIGAATWAVARALDPSAEPVRIFAATAASWLAGFVAGPVPAGVGVREGAFVALAGLPAGVGAAAALLARLAFVTVDSVGAVVALSRTRPTSSPARPSRGTPQATPAAPPLSGRAAGRPGRRPPAR